MATKSAILESLNKLGFIIVSPVTYSMWPLIRPNIDQVVFKKKSHYDIGDIVLYKRTENSNLMMHRVKKVEPGGYILHGDNTDYTEFISDKSIFAAATEIYKKNKKIICNSFMCRMLTLYCFAYRTFRKTLSRILHRIRRTNNG